MKNISIFAALVLALFAPTAGANICDAVKNYSQLSDTKQETQDEIKLYKSLFPNPDYQGSMDYNAFVLECNRRRDSKGDEIRKILTNKDWADVKEVLKKSDLPPYLYNAKFNFFGIAPFKMSYLLWKEKGVWKLLIPYKFEINESVKDRIDLHLNHAGKLYDQSQVDPQPDGTFEKKSGAPAIASTSLCTTTTFVKGQEKKYDGKNGADAHKRDRENRHIDLGKIEFAYKDANDVYQPRTGCRVNRKVHLYGVNPLTGNFEKILPEDWILNNFEKASEDHWSTPEEFELIVLLKGKNESRLDASTKAKVDKFLKNNDYLKIVFGSKFLPNANQMYKTNAWQPNNFSTMTTEGTYTHEVGHALGLDDEYAQKSASEKKDCENSKFNKFNGTSGTKSFTIKNYTMCDGYGDQVNTIYHYLAASRYVLGEICKTDSDCGTGRYCNNRLGLNRCLADATKSLGESCIKDKECQSNSCQKDKCVCKKDSDCGSGKKCKKPITGPNRCE